MKMRVLVVEDSSFQRRVIEEELRSHDYSTLGAGSGAEAVKLLREGQQVTVVVTDYEMPEMTGTDLFRQVQEEFGERTPDFILCTASQDVEALKEAKHLGFRDIVVKASGFERLLAALDMMQRVLDALPEHN